MGMVGGGPGAFIGPIHRIAAQLDGHIRLVAGAFSRDPAKSRATAEAWGLDAARGYPDFASMFEAESRRPDGIELVAIVTPNHLHYPVTKAALDAGLHVMCDKPATLNYREAEDLIDCIASSQRFYGLTYTYTGYAMVREARALVASGMLGTVRKVLVEYCQGWLATRLEAEGHKQASWRADPQFAGKGGCVADIGVHAFNMLEFVTGRRVSQISARLSAVIAGRVLDDDCNMLLQLDNGAPGVLVASQIATGERNALRLRVWGEFAGLDWSHDAAQTLTIHWAQGGTEIRHASAANLGRDALTIARLPPGHPEGYIEAFATLYRDFADSIQNNQIGPLVQGIDEGARGMALIERAGASSDAGGKWMTL